ncbi:hypothetical protein, partial [Limnospira sp. Paracas R14]|uniref:hypothetical protein n=1 Tax=Limnospira sp. Paracas R14 TaxID=2981108 RepID=UPI0028E12C3D|nr:hypothetical protein [Limnospira sp. Paracas R14]
VFLGGAPPPQQFGKPAPACRGCFWEVRHHRSNLVNPPRLVGDRIIVTYLLVLKERGFLDASQQCAT